mmetsp:Transcript_3801/g.15022  ORF Transcript_3801/g.15022 Transcript_3801/m.15022 type:complete len:233 (-) Transcript_3801:699-1397(-)
MLDLGRQKVRAAQLDATVRLDLGDATRLGFASSATEEDASLATYASFDKVSIAFRIRNIPDVAGALREMRRAAKLNATLAILESGAASSRARPRRRERRTPTLPTDSDRPRGSRSRGTGGASKASTGRRRTRARSPTASTSSSRWRRPCSRRGEASSLPWFRTSRVAARGRTSRRARTSSPSGTTTGRKGAPRRPARARPTRNRTSCSCCLRSTSVRCHGWRGNATLNKDAQ